MARIFDIHRPGLFRHRRVQLKWRIKDDETRSGDGQFLGAPASSPAGAAVDGGVPRKQSAWHERTPTLIAPGID